MLLKVSKLKGSFIDQNAALLICLLMCFGFNNSLKAQNTPPVLEGVPPNITVQCAADAPGDPGSVTATSDCSSVPTIDYDQIEDIGSCANRGYITNVWTATDCNGLMSTEVQIVRVNDDTPPDPENAPADIIITCPDGIPSPIDLTATDNCSPEITASPVDEYVPAGSPTCIGQTTLIRRTWTFIDECGNEAVEEQMITINAMIEPSFNEPVLPQDLDLDCDEVIPRKAVLSVMDGCGNMLRVMCTQNREDGDCPMSYTLVREWRANDCAGNEVSHIQRISISDEEAPEIDCLEMDAFLDENGEVTVSAVDFVNNADDNCSSYEYEINEDHFNCFEVGLNDIVLTVTDACGNSTTCETTVNVIDNIAPTCSLETTDICLGANGTYTLTPEDLSLETEENCTIESIQISPETLTCDNLGDVNVSVIVTDINGQESQCTVDIVVEDCRKPVLSCTDVTEEILDPSDCELVVTWEAPTVSGICPDLVGPVMQVDGPMSGDALMPGNYTATYQVIANNGESASCAVHITVLEYQPDGLVCRNINLSLNDDCLSELTPQMVLGNEDIGCLDHYEIEVWDPHGNAIGYILDDTHLAQFMTYQICLPVRGLCCWGNLIVEDKAPPELECDEIVVSACNGLSSVLPPVAEDNCSNATVVLINQEYDAMPCDPDYVALVVRTYVARDASGAESDPCEQMIYLERPIITDLIIPDNAVVNCDSLYEKTLEGYPAPSETGVPTNLAGDEFFPDVPDQFCNTLVTFTDELIATTNCTKLKIMRTWEIREWWCTGEKTFGGTQFIEVVDNTGPVIVMPHDMNATTTYECEARVTLPKIDADDFCGGISGYSVKYPGGFMNTNGGIAMLPLGENMIEYTAYDHCYNSTTDTMMVYVEDNTLPVAICDQNTVVSIPKEGWVDVLAEVFDDGSWDDCGIHSIEARRMDIWCNVEDSIWGPSVEFCCDDLGLDLMVALRVTDYEGNTNACMVNVRVQDKVAPTLYCPKDTIIECTTPYDLNQLSNTFGAATTDGNCSEAGMVEVVKTDFNQCGLGVITRHFKVGEEGDSDYYDCYQYITVVNNNPFNPSSIVWPQDYETTDLCDIENLDPEDLDFPYAEPSWTDDICDLIGVNYEDEEFDFTSGAEACVKIIRTWTLINWCQVDDNDMYRTWSHPQVIKLNNTGDPEIAGDCPDRVKCTFNASCEPGPIDLLMTATDDCTPDSLLSWVFEIDLYNDGSIDSTGYTNDTTRIFPIGVHKIYWMVQDRCGNQDRCEELVELRNCTAPTPVCIQGLSVDLVPMDTLNNDGIPDAEMATLWASDFNASSFHTCNNGFVFSFTQDTMDKYMTYDCDDIGINIVTMWVTDTLTGAQDFCQTFIDVQDNNSVDICPPGSGNNLGSRISGNIMTEMSEEVNGVTVELVGSEMGMEQTDLSGSYAFVNPDVGNEYIVDPSKNDDHLNGVSTLDLVLIQRHILGGVILDSPYKLIAADINKDESISSIDLIELRKLILGIYTDFPQNESWRFIDAEQSFADASNPWMTPLQEEYNTGMFYLDMEVDFVGVKVGDVNNNVISNFNNADTELRNRENLELYTDVNVLNKGEEQIIDFKLSDAQNLTGMQFTIVKKGIEILDLSSDHFELNDGNHANLSTEFSTISIYDYEGLSFNGDDVLFSLKVKATEDISVEQALAIGSSVTKAEAYNTALNTMGVQLRNNTDIISLHQNTPNPWSESTQIGFDLTEDTELTFSFYNTIGAKIFEKSGQFRKGYQTIDISAEDIGTSGVIIYELLIGNKKYNKKMILMK